MQRSIVGILACRLGVLAVVAVSPAHATTLVSDFEDRGLPAGQYWNGSDRSKGFLSGWAFFRNAYDTNWSTWSGFSYSSVRDTNTAGYGNQYAVWTPGAGVGGTGTYAVVYDSAWDEQDIATFPFPVCVKGFYANNTTYAALSMRDGDGFAKKFGGPDGTDPDWLKLTVTGRDRAGRSVGSVEFYLADYRFTNSALDFIVGAWTWVDLTALGSEVKSLHFSLSSSDTGAWGMNTPAYFALDGLVYVPKPAVLTADFEDQGLPAGRSANGSDLSGGFRSEGVLFRNAYDTNWLSWSGFALSSVRDTNTAGYGNQYAVWTPGAGVGGTGTYAVVYDSAWDEQDIVTFPFPALVKGLYVNNTTYVARSMRDGDGFAKKFGGPGGTDPDWLKLTVSGKDRAGRSVGSVDFYLADYRFTNGALDFVVGDWTWVDLTTLGPAVKTLHFALSSSDTGNWGMNTPAYFAVDGIDFAYTFSAYAADENLYDSPVPGFVGPGGDGASGGAGNYVNRAFAGWAAAVAAYSPTPGVASQWLNASNSLGPVTGDNMHIASLGELTREQIDRRAPPGAIALRMATPIADEEGPDFAVFENSAAVPGTELLFGELGYVEVSSDGAAFTRFPAVCLSSNAVGPYLGFDVRLYGGLCGKHANAYGVSWGTPFDLSDLAGHPDVRAGRLDLANVNYVRIVDVPGNGSFHDAFSPSNPIFDPWPTFGSGGLDLEAVGVINSPRHARVTTRTKGPGRISPYGMPGGVVAVPHGSNVTFEILADPGYRVIELSVNGVNRDAATRYAFTNVLADQRITAAFGSRLVIASPHGASAPAVGTHYGYGPLTVSVAGSPATRGSTQYVCSGWTGSGSVPASGTGAVVRINLTNDSTLAWRWDTRYRLDIAVSGPGRVDRASGWHASAQNVTCVALPDPYYAFAGWAGDVQGDTNALTMTVPMDRPRRLTARFGAAVADHGVPLAWLRAYRLTNAPPREEALADRDRDGRAAWQEFYAGTDPNDPASRFAIVDFGIANGSNRVVWLGGTNGARFPFTVQSAGSLRSGWRTLDGAVTRSGSGTNAWLGPHAASNRFYRILVRTD